MPKKDNKCPICGLGSLTEKKIKKAFEYKGETHTVSNYLILECNACNESLAGDKENRRIEKELTDFRRKIDRLLTSGEIKAIRKKLGYTQEKMAELLGVAPKTFSRYENGQVTQSKAMDNLLRSIDYTPAVINAFTPAENYEILGISQGHLFEQHETYCLGEGNIIYKIHGAKYAEAA